MALIPAALFAVPFIASAHSIPYFGPIIETSWNQCPLGFGAFMNVINNIITVALSIAIVFVAPISFAWAGFLMVMNPTSLGDIKKGKAIFTNTIIGIVVALAGWMIVDAFMAIFYNPSAVGATWYSLVTTSGVDPCILQPSALNTLSPSAGQTMTGAACPSGLTCDISTNTCLPPRQTCNGVLCFAGQVCAASDGSCVYPAGVSCAGGTCSPNDTCVNNQCVSPQSCSIAPSATGITAAGGQYLSFDPNAASAGPCSASYLSSLNSSLTVAQADTFACLAKYESSCGANIQNYNWNKGSSAYGAFQVTLSSNHAAYENQTCYQAASVSGPLNCQNGFTPQGNPLNNSTETSCTTAAAQTACSLASAVYVQQHQGWGAWTADSSSSNQAQCIQQFSTVQ